MSHTKDNLPKEEQVHITSYKDHFSTLIALLLLTVITVVISVFGANLRSLSVFTALLIATVKVIVVAYYFMHLKYDKKIYTWLVLIVAILFVSFAVLTSIEYLNR
ncbi:MAG: cytochrome C oxidase subunit IV family protein [Bacteroidales bacterium]|jgi:cytochrome c oxidase subunit 4|nr:cytochrome C oxidase subunit IV family protein [Bacteroidales bacterium]MDD4086923.1 cytochrome C oxidase subunit IV family protein [Bacteroidales bacterium]MDY0084726.1 cytochrome C oxidase subunit IV family protein [Bacteroidales bacterium]